MTNSSTMSDWKPSLSFCFITNGAKPEKLQLALQSVRALGIPNYEIIISGKPPKNFAAPDTKFVELPSAADNGQLGAMRNAACRIANYEILVVADDDILFQEDFYEGICAYGPNFDVASCRILNTDGSRYWDYAVINSPTGHHLIPYSQKSPHTHITGGLVIMHQHFFKAIEWNEERGFYKEEDVEFSKRIRDAGYNISFNTFSSVIHNDDSYYRIEDRVEVRKIPACWQEISPAVYAQGIFSKIRDFFLQRVSLNLNSHKSSRPKS